jgi:hypothetical protein
MGELLTAQKFGLSWMRQKISHNTKPAADGEIFAKIDSLGLLMDENGQSRA